MFPLGNDTTIGWVEMVGEFCDKVFFKSRSIDLLQILLLSIVQLTVIVYRFSTLKKLSALMRVSAQLFMRR